jgi:parallel beta-helix repeat protein
MKKWEISNLILLRCLYATSSCIAGSRRQLNHILNFFLKGGKMQTKAKKTAVLIIVGLVVLCLYSYANAQTPILAVPVTITSPGSYCFTSDLQNSAPDSNAIVVDVDDVTIDLMGYNLIGSGSGQGRGIYINARANVEIRNGTVRDFGAEGIFEIGMAGPENNPRYGYGHRIIGMRVLFNGLDGIWLFGFGHLVKDCTVSGNEAFGIWIDTDCTVTDNIIFENSLCGLIAGLAVTVTGNTVCANGSDGVAVYSGCTVSGNTVEYNNGSGIWAQEGCNVTGNTAYDNAWGIYVASDGNLIKSNTFRSNAQAGISVDGTDNAIEENLVTDSPVGFDFIQCGNFYANNRAAGNGNNYVNTACQTDGGGNF